MLLAGDEFLRTQHGNNNAWCQDNEISWLDWSLAVKNSRFPAVRARADRAAQAPPGPAPPALLATGRKWPGTASSRTGRTSRRTAAALALTLDGRKTGREPDRDFYMAFNAWREPLPFVVPPSPQGKRWRRVIDTALAPPLDIVGLDEGPEARTHEAYAVAPHRWWC